MLETMYVRCTHCGYDNSPEYRFCGMCGATLAHAPVPTTKPATAAASEPPHPSGNGGSGKTETVHGPSFLGLAEDPKVEFHYLYEDEQPKSHVGLIVFLLIIFGAAGYLGWQWKHNGFPFNRLNQGPSAQSASPSEVAPAQTQDQQTHIDKPMTGGAGDVLPTQPDQQAQQNPPAKPTETPQGAPANNASAENKSQPGETAEKPEEKPAEVAKATPPAGISEASKTSKAPRTPAPKPAAAKPAVPAAPDADLELAGERYLYGNGVPQNCARAESNLRTAATHGNTKAQTVLGTMYATGHCVGRDLPTAYRWFARALHQEPQNSRISADLQVLWRQMTPQEKQLATASRP
ncbi:MAG TPA: zinc-ribbon domain-containing protein [Terriglobales bacterium]|nr:zinc-ribbon domain-containing protein [Terriglobales bacterium]